MRGSLVGRARLAQTLVAQPWTLISTCTAVLATTIALAPAFGILPIALMSLCWIVLVPAAIWVAVARGVRQWTWAHWVFLACVSMATVRMASLGIVQWVGGRQSLFWNVDWRYHATQAHGISRFNGASNSLDYAGEPLEYHAGPSWIAGSLNDVVGLPVNWVLFFVVPIICTVLISAAGYQMLRLLGAAQRVSLLAVALVVNLPVNPWMLTYNVVRRREASALLDPTAWWFSAGLMLNSLFALCVGMVAVTLMTDTTRQFPTRLVAAVALGTLAVLKPQYLVGFCAAIGIGFLAQAISLRTSHGLWKTVVLGASLGLSASVFYVAAPSPMTFTDMEFHPFGVITKWLIARQTFLITATIVVLVSVLASRRNRLLPATLSRYSIGAVVGAVALLTALDGTTFLVSDVQIAQAQAIGLDFLASSQDGNLSQAMLPVLFLLLLMATAIAMLVFMRRQSWLRLLPLAAVGMAAALIAPLTVWALLKPTGSSALEWSEELDLHALVREVDPAAGVWISSDLSDPAQNFKRPLMAVNLTSLAPTQFYLSNGAFVGWVREDVVERVENLNRFFNTEWSPWHDSFLAGNGIAFVAIRTRCPPRWTIDDFPAGVGISRGDWVVLTVDRARETDTLAEPAWPRWNNGQPLYGVGTCLTGATVSGD